MGNWIGFRTALPLLLVMAAAIGLNVFLTSAKSEASFAAVENSRFQFIVERIKGAVQHNLDLGLSLEGMAGAQGIVNAEMKSDGVLALSIRSASKQVLYRAGVEPDKIPADSLSVRTDLSDNLGQLVGDVVLNFDAAERRAFRENMREEMLPSALMAFGAGAGVVLLAGLFLLTPIQRRLGGLAASVEAGGTEGRGDEDLRGVGARAVLDEVEQRLAAAGPVSPHTAAQP